MARTFRRSCRRKRVFATEIEAQAQARSHGAAAGYEAYKCRFVEGHWHVGHVRNWKRREAARQRQQEVDHG